MKITHQRSDLEVKFRARDLLPVRNFISYCKDYGIKVNKDELEYFDRNDFMLPALWVNRGYSEMRKILDKNKNEWVYVHSDDLEQFDYDEIEPELYYSSGGFFIGESNWLEPYEKAGMTKVPAREKFQNWNNYSEAEHFVKDKRLVENAFEPFYSKSQLYQLRFLTHNLQINLKNGALFGDDEQWKNRGHNIQQFMENLVNHFIKPKMPEYCKLVGVLADVKNMIIPINKEFYEAYNKSLEESEDSKDALRDAQARIEYLLGDKKKEAQNILERHSLTIEGLKDMRTMLLQAGTFSLDIKFKKRRKAYVKNIEEEVLIDSEDPYKDTAFINSFLVALGEKPQTVRQLLLETDYDVCKICGGNFEKTRKNQVTCGSSHCKKERNNQIRRDQRKINPKYGR